MEGKTPFSRLSECEESLRKKYNFNTLVNRTVESHFLVEVTDSGNSYDDDLVHEIASEYNLYSFD